MPRAKTNKFYRTFSKGLITEAGFLTYPEDASSDELNTILSRKGNRSRRLGADFQPDYVLNSLSANDSDVVHEFVWPSVNNDPNFSFVCVQLGSKLHFFRMINGALSANRKVFVVDLLAYKIPTASASDFPLEYCDMSAGSGFLFVAHRFMDPLSVEYLPETDTITVVPITIQVRDFEGVYDGLANDDEPTTLSAQHHYNLLNQGWVVPGTGAVGSGVGSGVGAGGAGDNTPYYDPYRGGIRFFDERGAVDYV